jgi:acetyl esterase/lipase
LVEAENEFALKLKANNAQEKRMAMISRRRVTLFFTFVLLFSSGNLVPRAFSRQAPPQQGTPQSTPALEGVQVERNIIFGMYGGLALLMDVYHPVKPNGFGVIYIEGSGWSMAAGYGMPPLKNLARTGVSPYVRIMALAGYTVFAIDHRAAPIFHYPAQIEDAQRAVRYIRFHAKDYGIDPAHIAAGGYSSGAHLASLLGLLDGAGKPADRDPVNRESGRVQCVIAGGTPAGLVPAAGYANAEGFALLSNLIGEAVQAPVTPGSSVYEKLTSASPISHVEEGDPPFLLIHGDADELVPYANAEALRGLLQKAGATVKLVTVNGGTHSSTVMDHNAEYSAEIVRWLDQYLRGISPAK